ncbi:hypothetical protein PsorP6_007350 [Peronosclerospora sorghi]|uniref:Uncharacterized protein n=1 Tax=Peronosclerospora sorghi TaxID=230839 RepID=A0ACC0W8R4_9STRA|nr:hypothetical protein PsorP6_007350 [Peronosclerospora sorghi]
MEKQAFSLEEEVRQLCEQEQTKHTALLKQRLYSRVGQFLMGSLDMRHWWCGYSTLMVFTMRVLELYPTTESVCVLYKRMIQQLRTVDIYHASMESVHIQLEFEFTPDSIKLFFIKLQGMDAHRIHLQLEETEWAKKMVQHFGKIQLTVDDGKMHYMLDVLDEWICILDNEEFNKSLLLLDINTTKHLQDVSIRVAWGSPQASCSHFFFIQT